MTGNTGHRQVVLVVDDDRKILKSYEMTLMSRGLGRVIACNDSRQVMTILETQPVDVILLDLMMPELAGRDLLPLIVEKYPDIPVIISTGVDDVDTAVQCIRSGARDYLLKPVERNRFLASITRFLELRALQKENASLKQRLLVDSLQNPEAFSSIITQNRTMLSIFRYMEAIADSSEPVLITGETGTGKELIAQAIYRLGGVERDPATGESVYGDEGTPNRKRAGTARRAKFIAVNVAGLDDNMFSDTLFGHRKGAFTDARHERAGLVEEAEGGVLFLDEIGDLSIASQVKLLRLLQEKEYYPLGSDRVKQSDCRVVCSTHRALEQAVQAGEFRNDLYYRLRTHRLHIPPLRERLDDLALLADFFVEQAAESISKEKPRLPHGTIDHLARYQFPGNIRELRAMIYDSVSSGDFDSLKNIARQPGSLTLTQQPEVSGGGFTATHLLDRVRDDFSRYPTLPTLAQLERIIIREAVKRVNGNVSEAARLLGVHRQTAAKWLKDDNE